MKDLLAALRLVLVTDGRGDVGRLRRLAEAAVEGGVRAVQLREPGLDGRALAVLCEKLQPHLRARGALLIVNDRADLVAAGLADGVHLGQRSLPPALARRAVGAGALIGVSTHDAVELAAAAAGGADYASLSPVFPTRCKPGATALGAARAALLAAGADLPVVWLGGIDAGCAATLRAARPFGVAVMSALCDATDPASAAAGLAAIVGW